MDASAARVHKFALGLTVFLFVVFIAVTGLYSAYGHRFVLRVFEANQTYRAEISRGAISELHLSDYLRVDPGAIRVREKLIDKQIQNGRSELAVDTALAGLQHADNGERTYARLLVVRAQLADGELDAASATLAALAADSPDCAEAHAYAARLDAARGEFANMRAEFERVATADPGDSTDSFKSNRRVASTRMRHVDPATETLTAAEANERMTMLLLLGRVDDAFAIVSRISSVDKNKPEAEFWRGVYEEEQGNVDVARASYAAAARAGHPLAEAVLRRLKSD